MSRIWNHIRTNQPRFAKSITTIANLKNLESPSEKYTPTMILEAVLKQEDWVVSDLKERINKPLRWAEERIGLSVVALKTFSIDEQTKNQHVFELKNRHYTCSVDLIREDLRLDNQETKKRRTKKGSRESKHLFRSWRKNAGI